MTTKPIAPDRDVTVVATVEHVEDPALLRKFDQWLQKLLAPTSEKTPSKDEGGSP